MDPARMSLAQQWRRCNIRAQANAPAAWHWLRLILNDGRREDKARGAVGEICDVVVVCRKGMSDADRQADGQ